MSDYARTAWFIFSRPESRDKWWVNQCRPILGEQAWDGGVDIGTASDIEGARALIPDIERRTCIWSTEDPQRCTREIWQ